MTYDLQTPALSQGTGMLMIFCIPSNMMKWLFFFTRFCLIIYGPSFRRSVLSAIHPNSFLSEEKNLSLEMNDEEELV